MTPPDACTQYNSGRYTERLDSSTLPPKLGIRVVKHTRLSMAEASQQQTNHRHLDVGFARLYFAFIVHHQPPVAKQPGECAFNDTSFWLLAPPTSTRHALDDFELIFRTSPCWDS